MNRFVNFGVLAASIFIVIQPVPADYFHDQGYLDAEYRTEFDSKTEGTSSNPLQYDSTCKFGSSFCGTGPDTGIPDLWYSSSSSVWNTGADFWVLSVNNEPAFSNQTPPTGIDGVPNLVHELYPNTSPLWMSRPASFAAVTGSLIGETFPRAHLVARHLGPTGNSNDPNGDAGLPFISIGAQSNRGNNKNVGAMNAIGRTHTVTFEARIWDIIEPDPGPYPDGGLWFMMYAISKWGGKFRGVFLNLKHLGDNTDWSTSWTNGLSNLWNWPIQESFFNPGVDWAYIDSEDLYGPLTDPRACDITTSDAPQMTSTGVDYSFSIDLEELFRCASARGLFTAPMPTTKVPIKGVHWAVEMNGVDGGIWASVHDMKMQ